MVIDYSAWAAPIGGRGLSNQVQFSVEKKFGSEPVDGPTNTNYSFGTVSQAAINGDVSLNAVDPDADPLSYSLVPLSGPTKGLLEFNADGTFVYSPSSGFVGYDNFFFVTSDGNNEIIREVVIQSSAALPTPPLPQQPFTQPIFIDRNRLKVDPNSFRTTFAVEGSPGLRVGDIYRVTVRQPTLDCDCNEFIHISCYDFVVVKC